MISEILMFLSFITIFIIVHLLFKNIRQVFLWSCKIITTCYIWGVLWIVTQLHQLPEWKLAFEDSVQDLWSFAANVTKEL